MSALSYRQIHGGELKEALLRTGVAIIAASETKQCQVAFFSVHGVPFSYLFGKRIDATFSGFLVEGGSKADRKKLLRLTQQRMMEQEGGESESITL